MINLLTDTIESIEIAHADGIISMAIKHSGEEAEEVYTMTPDEFYKFSLAIIEVRRALREHWHRKGGDE